MADGPENLPGDMHLTPEQTGEWQPGISRRDAWNPQQAEVAGPVDGAGSFEQFVDHSGEQAADPSDSYTTTDVHEEPTSNEVVVEGDQDGSGQLFEAAPAADEVQTADGESGPDNSPETSDEVEDDLSDDRRDVYARAGQDGTTPEKVEQFFGSHAADTLDYGHKLAKTNELYGKPLASNLVVYRAVGKIADEYPALLENGAVENHDVRLSLRPSSAENNILDITVQHKNGEDKTENWTALVVDEPGVTANQYSVTTRTGKSGEFDYTTTTQTRELTKQDAYHLQDLLKDAKFDPASQHDFDLAA